MIGQSLTTTHFSDAHQVQDAVTSDCQDKAAPTTVIQGESPVITEVEENISTESEIARVEEQGQDSGKTELICTDLLTEVNGENSAVGFSENTSTQKELTSTQVKGTSFSLISKKHTIVAILGSF